MEALHLVCGGRKPQLKRDPLGGPNWPMPLHDPNPYTERWRAIVARYLAGQQPVDSAAAELARALKDWQRALDANRPTTLGQLLEDQPNLDALYASGHYGSELSEADYRRLTDLMEALVRCMDDPENGAA